MITPVVSNLPWNTMVDPSSTSVPVMFEPPPQLSGGRHEVWIAAGGGEHWGGAEVWGSVTGDSYDKLGSIERGCAVGALASELSASADGSFAVDLAPSLGVLFPGSQVHADKLVTLCWVDGEYIAFTAAHLSAPFQYILDGYLRRGIFDGAVAKHSIGSLFARLNQAIWRFEYPPHLVGETVYVKLLAHNEFNQMAQTLDEVQAHTMILTGASARLLDHSRSATNSATQVEEDCLENEDASPIAFDEEFPNA